MATIWSTAGYAAFTGSELALYRRLDDLFVHWALQLGATEYQFPNFISAADLEKISYMESFGHLATVVTAEDILTPAACYHFYSALQNSSFDDPKLLTTRANCFRRESHYEPLKRQWCFGMREIVCIGDDQAVNSFLIDFQTTLEQQFKDWDLNVTFEHATDPFFNAPSNPKYLMQKIDPVKQEMVFDDNLAIGSLNRHRTTFGEAFKIRVGGETAHTACVAFGIERWMYALKQRFGEDEKCLAAITF